MNCISMWQPWATAYLLTEPDEKLYETRDFCASRWKRDFKGPMLVHAAKKQDGEVREYLNMPYTRDRLALHGLTVDHLAFGAIIGMVYLLSSTPMRKMLKQPDEIEQFWGNWSPERYAWMRGMRTYTFHEPIPYRGQQGFFDVPDELVREAIEKAKSGGGIVIPEKKEQAQGSLF